MSLLTAALSLSSEAVIFTQSTSFGDGHFSFKSIDGVLDTSTYTNDAYSPFEKFCTTGGDAASVVNGCSCLVCGYDEEDVTYDDYKINGLASGLKFVSHSSSNEVVNNQFIGTYTKTLFNNTSETITINCIGVIRRQLTSLTRNYLMYKEKLPQPIEVPANANVILTFTTKTTLGQNKPTDYVATASVE